MNPAIALVLLLYFLSDHLVLSAPVGVPVTPDLPFSEATERAKALVEKILKDIPAAYAGAITTEGLTLDPLAQSPHLQMMMSSLGIPPPPVIRLPSESFTLDVWLSRMSAGARLYQCMLGVLSERLGVLSSLHADLRDLGTHVAKMAAAVQFGDADAAEPTLDLASRLHGNYEVQVAAHLTLTQLRSFCHDLMRSLRAAAAYRPPSPAHPAAGTG